MRVRKMSGGRNNPVAKRLRHLRAVFSGDDNGARLARRVGMSYPRWNNFENGFPLSLEAAHLLVKAVPGLTLDYLFYGHDAGCRSRCSAALLASSTRLNRRRLDRAVASDEKSFNDC